ncbi:polysaccharide pyruvyl transferase family protein [Desulfobulbus elongatus]|uniref:polysaccharide pyruvyl transferase family protein n=1 Tax=Desulfobulbus elongatus TaxID=53332 RepID=UPI000A003270|nr:polysaccharide pyruvyl transferase family protein [Desulfobulbus elongatus]
MKPFFLRDTKNFGDYSNHWLWPKLIGDLLDEEDNIRLVGIGSLLKSDLNYVAGKKIIFGPGSGYGSFPHLDSIKDWIFYFVRGPLTAEKFGLPPEKSIVDGAWLVSLLPDFAKEYKKKGVCFIPHWKTAERGDWEQVCQAAGMMYIDPMDDFEKIVNAIASSELVITESLHGAIFADLFRTPWIPVKISQSFLNFKWIDWCQSIDVPFKIIQIPCSNFIDCLSSNINPFGVNFKVNINDSVNIEPIKESVVKVIPPLYYKYLMILKKMLRIQREKMFRKMKIWNQGVLIKCWNEKYTTKLANLLKNVSLLEPTLSNDKVKAEKIERLENILYKLRKDYQNGFNV